MVKIVCNVCGSANIKQEAAIMVDPNSKENPKLDDFVWQDFYWCEDCNEETEAYNESFQPNKEV